MEVCLQLHLPKQQNMVLLALGVPWEPDPSLEEEQPLSLALACPPFCQVVELGAWELV